MKYKAYPIQIWFLDKDLQLSAQQLNNKLLYHTIKGCMQSLIAARFYFIGIRNKKFYKYFFSKERKQETMDKFFPLWPMEKQPLFTNYDTRQSKWVRKCKEHVNYIKTYLDILCQEYEYRFKKQASAEKFLEWLDNDAPQLNIPEGHINTIVIEWKSIDPKFRNKDIIEGYRAKYKAMLQNDGIKITDFTNRDIPSFLIDEEISKQKNEKWLN